MSHPTRLRQKLLSAFATASMTAILPAGQVLAQEETDLVQERIVVPGSYQPNGLSSAKQTQPLVETPQTITIVPDQLLLEQGRRTLRDSLRNVTGISIQAGEGNPPAGDALKIRGNSARDSLYVDGIRDVGNYFRDPFNAHQVEVTKGPASVLAGRGNPGGTVNIVTRRPSLTAGSAAEISAGTDSFYRGVLDYNTVIDPDRGLALRINAMAHSADEPGRDVVKNERWAINPVIGYGLGTDTEITLGHLHIQFDEIPDNGLPNARNRSLAGSGFEGRVAPVSRSNFYGYSTDYRDIRVDVTTLRVDHQLTGDVSLRSQTRYGHNTQDSVTSSPRFVGNVTTLDPTTQAVGNQKPRDEANTILITQNDLTSRFSTGPITHTLVTGFELSRELVSNRRRLDVNGPPTNLFDPVLQAAAPIAYNGTSVKIRTDVAALYILDNIEISPQWEINLALRYDELESRVRGLDSSGNFPGFVTDLTRKDSELSGSAALVYKPVANSSVYLAYGTGFEASGRIEIVQPAGGNNNPPTTPAQFNVDPERNRSWELGAKYDALNGALSLATAIFRIEKTNARTPGVNPGDPPVVLDGEQRIDGFEMSAAGAITPDWNIFAGYTYLNGEVTKSNVPFEIGQRLDNTPEHSLNLWSSYDVTPRLRVGGGLQFVDERTSNIPSSATAGNIVITSPSYTVGDLFASYALTDKASLRLNVYNVTDEFYFLSFQSAQSIPAPARSAVLSLEVKF
jgi:catecholate siderophore receptor